ncbi:GDSL-type esterase/lipase family protein [Dyadobacter chenwenxiniae]|uniref:GDSL-type esterase/lipase family protein n=1 Tax=Dyadobacter chenwenxiniae TaxID=2906456 RepID=A0A9X1PN03_9BACT|nr:GDSL-type esterase/lipase family protein [Dyadobacter chenwenxiniae]MCF0052594.1 GDSL-type esterase/lipase family protein [Dyadobacter chenwenxiniae]MCF0063289.1 GDSL-type esterase/lipase family protein [Dyadobacter chenwenxiniae]UON85331.1 GDSL-type esterase/lipase family protein [Dyadobacter chenwenxiniae]
MNWYEDEVQRVEKESEKLPFQPETLFYGSSSITLWTTLYTDFEDIKPVNLGFGGSTLAACSWFFNRIMAQISAPKTVIIYAGDNDLGDGRNPMEVCLYYRQLIGQIREKFGDIPCYYISIKPSLQRWEIIAQIRTANRLILDEINGDPNQHYINIFPAMLDVQGTPVRGFFEQDGLHLSPAGYAVWTKEIRNALNLPTND